MDNLIREIVQYPNNLNKNTDSTSVWFYNLSIK